MVNCKKGGWLTLFIIQAHIFETSQIFPYKFPNSAMLKKTQIAVKNNQIKVNTLTKRRRMCAMHTFFWWWWLGWDMSIINWVMTMVIVRWSDFSLFLFYRVGAHSFPVSRYISVSVVWSTVHILWRARLFSFSRIGMFNLRQTTNAKVFSNAQKTSEIILVYLKK